jgi:hypothetical protein
MNILCYGESAERQKQRCEFFQGTGCCAEWATELNAALELLVRKPFDSVVFGRSIPVSECDKLAEVMHLVRPRLEFFSLAAIESKEVHTEDPTAMDQASLVSIYLKLSGMDRFQPRKRRRKDSLSNRATGFSLGNLRTLK